MHGDPYTWAATCRWLDHETVEVMGAVKGPSKTEWLAVLECFKGLGAKQVQYTQYRNGKLLRTRKRPVTRKGEAEK